MTMEKITTFSRTYIFIHGCFFHCHVRFRGCKLNTKTARGHQVSNFQCLDDRIETWKSMAPVSRIRHVPLPSMYGISTYTQMICMVNVGKFTSPTDPICESGGVHTGALGVDPSDTFWPYFKEETCSLGMVNGCFWFP